MNGQTQASTTHRFLVRVGYCLLLIAILASSLPHSSVQAAAYVDPTLTSAGSPTLSVIIRAKNAQRAAYAVNQIGGTVTNHLWIIDSVAAEIPAAKLTTLAHHSEVWSIVTNRSIESADEPFDGWVTPLRISDGKRTVAGELEGQPVALPDGGLVAISDKGTLQIFNADGSQRQRLRLSKGDYPLSPLVDNSGNIFVAGDKNKVYGISSTGALLWSYTHGRTVTSVALNSDAATLFVGDSKGQVYALATNDRAKSRWHTNIGDGDVVSIRTGNTDAQNVFAVTSGGYIAALSKTGRVTWVMRQADAAPVRYMEPLVSDSTLYVIGSNRWVYALNANGSIKFRLRLPAQSTARVLAQDGTLFVGLHDGKLYGINTDGSVRYQISIGAKPVTDLFLSQDEATVHAMVNSQVLHALRANDGQEAWRYDHGADANSRAIREDDGLIHLVSGRGDYTILNAQGAPINHFSLAEKVEMSVVFGKDERHRVYIASNSKKLHTFVRMPSTWDGQPDASPTEVPSIWKLANPVAIDVGADMLHVPQLPNQLAITGKGVTVAVVDSGVQFTASLQRIAAQQVQTQFLGQADFVQKTCPESNGTPVGTQESDHCFLSAAYSQDGYGHGSHVAGIIWNQFSDATTGTFMGIAPEANLLSVRILDENGTGSYADAIEGIQYVVANQHRFNIRVLNLSISALAVTPYFVDPLNQAVERAWANGIVVLAAAGNEGPKSSTITVPGNDPYVITVGAVDSQRTPGYWLGDTVPEWSATGPTLDGFIKPDVLAPGTHIVSTVPESATISQDYPLNRVGDSLFRMNGTSMSTAVASGVVALMLQAHPTLTPDQVKFRLGSSARPAMTSEGYPVHTIFHQGLGRIWAPTAVFGEFPVDGFANRGMDIESDLAHGWIREDDLRYHYQGAVQKILSDDGRIQLYVIREGEATLALGAVSVDFVDGTPVADERKTWLSWQDISEETVGSLLIANQPGISWGGGLALPAGMATWAGGMATWAGGMATWAGGMATWAGGMATWAGGMATWAGGMATWAGGMATWAGGMATWAGGMATWAGGMATWAGGMATWAGGMATWAGGINTSESILASTTWVNDDGTTAEFQGNTVLNPLPEEPESRPSPDGGDLGIIKVFLPTVTR